jgi:hypothetical protein
MCINSWLAERLLHIQNELRSVEIIRPAVPNLLIADLKWVLKSVQLSRDFYK